MLNFSKSLKSGIAAFMITTMAVGVVAPAALAAPNDRRDERRDRDRDRRDDRREWDRRDFRDGRGRPEWRGDRHWNGPSRVVVVRPRPGYYRPYMVPRNRYYNHVRVYRPYGRVYPGFGFYYRDNDALRFLGLTALGLVVFNQLNEMQQRAHEEAMIEATSARIGEPIIWNQAGQSGSVTPVRDGRTPDGRPCREFRQEVMIGGNRTEAYGTACMQPDGSWEVVNE